MKIATMTMPASSELRMTDSVGQVVLSWEGYRHV
jgi:hypothetical protein